MKIQHFLLYGVQEALSSNLSTRTNKFRYLAVFAGYLNLFFAICILLCKIFYCEPITDKVRTFLLEKKSIRLDRLLLLYGGTQGAFLRFFLGEEPAVCGEMRQVGAVGIEMGLGRVYNGTMLVITNSRKTEGRRLF